MDSNLSDEPTWTSRRPKCPLSRGRIAPSTEKLEARVAWLKGSMRLTRKFRRSPAFDLSQTSADRNRAWLKSKLTWRKQMIRLIAVSAFALAFATSAQAMSPAPLYQTDGITTQVALGCGVGRTRVAGVCVARTTKRQVRRQARRCAVWGAGGVCSRWY